jgi:hypothetical protein
LSSTGKRTIEAGGNERFGRRDFVWAGGAAAKLDYQKRHVVGIAADFAEDVTRTNWGFEFTWFPNVIRLDYDQFDLSSRVDLYNFVISVDRPTFVRFLNLNRTFFANAQVFLQYTDGYRSSMVADGPFTALFTFALFTGYQQDRLLPGFTFVYDVWSRSGAALWSMTYRFSEALSAQVGVSAFFGTVESIEPPLVGVGGNAGGAGAGSQRATVERGLSTVRDRDEFFFRVRYTF